MNYLGDPTRVAQGLLNTSKLESFFLSSNDFTSDPIEQVLSQSNLLRNKGIIYSGQPIILGVIITNTSEISNDAFFSALESINVSEIRLMFNLRKQVSKGNVIGIEVPEEVTGLNIKGALNPSLTSTYRVRLKTSSILAQESLYVFMRTSIQVAKHHQNVPISLNLSIKISSDDIYDFMSQSKTIKQILEESRYQSSLEQPLIIPMNIVIKEPFEVSSSSFEDLSSSSCIWSINIENVHKTDTLIIHNLYIDLRASIKIDNRNLGDGTEDVALTDIGKLANKSIMGSDIGSSALTTYSDDGAFFNYGQEISTDSINKAFSVIPITLPGMNHVNFPIVIKPNEAYSFAYRVKMTEASFLSAAIDELVAQYLTPFTVWWGLSKPTTTTTLTNDVIPSNHRILWSIGISNVDWLQSAVKKQSPDHEIEPLDASFNATTSKCKLSDIVCKVEYTSPIYQVNSPVAIKIKVENLSSLTLAQVVVHKMTNGNVGTDLRSLSSSHCQYYIEHHSCPKSILPKQIVVFDMVIIPLLTGVVSLKDLVLREMETGQYFYFMQFVEIPIVSSL